MLINNQATLARPSAKKPVFKINTRRAAARPAAANATEQPAASGSGSGGLAAGMQAMGIAESAGNAATQPADGAVEEGQVELDEQARAEVAQLQQVAAESERLLTRLTADMQHADGEDAPKGLEAADNQAGDGNTGPATALGSGQTANAEEQRRRLSAQRSQDFVFSPEELEAVQEVVLKKLMRGLNYLLQLFSNVQLASADVMRYSSLLDDMRTVYKSLPEVVMGHAREGSIQRQKLRELEGAVQNLNSGKAAVDTVQSMIADVQRRQDKYAYLTALSCRKDDDIVKLLQQVLPDDVLISDTRLADLLGLAREQMPPLEQPLVQLAETAMEVSDGQPAGEAMVMDRRAAEQGAAGHGTTVGHAMPMQQQTSPAGGSGFPPMPPDPLPAGMTWLRTAEGWLMVPMPGSGNGNGNNGNTSNNGNNGNNGHYGNHAQGNGKRGHGQDRKRKNEGGNGGGGGGDGQQKSPRPGKPCMFCEEVGIPNQYHNGANGKGCRNYRRAVKLMAAAEEANASNKAN